MQKKTPHRKSQSFAMSSYDAEHRAYIRRNTVALEIQNIGMFFHRIYSSSPSFTTPDASVGIEEAIRRTKLLFQDKPTNFQVHVPKWLKPDFQQLQKTTQSPYEYDVLMKLSELFVSACQTQDTAKAVVLFGKSIRNWTYFNWLKNEDKHVINDSLDKLTNSESDLGICRAIGKLWRKVFGDKYALHDEDRKAILSFFLRWGDVLERFKKQQSFSYEEVEATRSVVESDWNNLVSKSTLKNHIQSFEQLKNKGTEILINLFSLKSLGWVALSQPTSTQENSVPPQPGPATLTPKAAETTNPEKQKAAAQAWFDQILGKYLQEKIPTKNVSEEKWQKCFFFAEHPSQPAELAELLKCATPLTGRTRTVPIQIHNEVCHRIWNSVRTLWGSDLSRLSTEAKEQIRPILADVLVDGNLPE
jgi:hypothetical protein